MGYQGKGKKNISANSQEWKWSYINERAKRIRWSVSMFSGAIIDDWFARGCPAIHAAEAKLPKMPQAPFEKEGDK